MSASNLKGSPEERINAWLTLEKLPDGHYRCGDWSSNIASHLKLHSYSAEGPHPSVTLEFTCQPQHCNRMNNLHGGCTATVFDWCTTMALEMVNKPGFWQYMGVSRTLNVTYMRPVPSGEVTLVECEIVQVGKKLCTLKGTMRRKSDGLLLATCEHGKVNIDPETKL